jgi:pilus assembly protein CpaC
VTDPSLVQIVQFGPTEFELIGESIGSTTLTLWFGEPDDEQQVLRYLIRVSAEQDLGRAEYGELQDRINELFPNSMIQLIPVLDKLIVRGQARDAKEAAEILSILSGNSIDQTGRLQGPGAQFNLGPTGTFPGQFEEGISADNLINLMEVPGEQQIMLKVRVAELSRSAIRDIGADFAIDRGDFTFSSLLGGGQGPVRAVLNTEDVTLALSALSGNSYSKILAEPNLITLNGRPASFIAGGQFAVPTVVGVGGVEAASTDFQSFGTQLSFTPTLVDKDRIRLTVVPTLSSLNQDNAVGGIPGLDTRTVSTTVDLREGQWLAIAGLIQDQQSGSETRVPWIGNMPVADIFFSGRTSARSETELVILVSPELVHPMEPEEVPLILPGMEVTEPNDCDFYLCGRYEGDPECQHRSTVWPLQQDRIVDAHFEALEQAKSTGTYQKHQQFYIHGPVGFSR